EGYAFRINPQPDAVNLYIHNNTFSGVRTGDPTEPVASIKISALNNATTLRFENNTAITDDQWFHLEEGDSLFQLKNTTWRVGDNPKSPFKPFYTFDWDEPGTAVTNMQFINNIFPDSDTETLFREASFLCPGGPDCRVAMGNPTDKFSSFFYDWTVDYTVKDGDGNPVVGATVVIKDKDDTQVVSGTTGSDGTGSAILHE